MRVEIVTSVDRLAALAPAWEELAARVGASMFSMPAFLQAWWRAFAGIDELRVLTVSLGEELVAVWPLRLRSARTTAFGARTLTPLGDARTLARSIICKPGTETVAAGAMLAKLLELRDWDFLDAPQEPDNVLEGLTRVAEQRSFSIELVELGERAVAMLPPEGGPAWETFARGRRPMRSVPGAAFAPAQLDVMHAVDELHRLLRREWAERDQASPVLDPALLAFLKEILPVMTPRKQGRVSLVALAGIGAIAADVVIVDGERHVQLLRGTDPAHVPAGATDQLCWESLTLAARSGATVFELADDDSPLATARVTVRRMQMWNGTAVGRLSHGMSALRRRGKTTSGPRSVVQKSALGRMLDAFAEARPESARKIVERLGNKTMHLYRGELFAQEVEIPPGLELKILDLAAFDAMPSEQREALMQRLELPAAYTREKWRRGDLAVVGILDGRPAGIGWCARKPVFVPDIGREISPATGECYIYEVFVHPDERGKKIAPAMLDHLSRYLRARDVYRAWALIERTNSSSVRAFERARYVAVADVVYVQMGIGSHLFVRPPDPEARALLRL